ncbi:MAG: hypothetical protein OXN89_06960 [Bryobacterales bacterium]|nr:hypothetical protein [Bryobacterales bacterium]
MQTHKDDGEPIGDKMKPAVADLYPQPDEGARPSAAMADMPTALRIGGDQE